MWEERRPDIQNLESLQVTKLREGRKERVKSPIKQFFRERPLDLRRQYSPCWIQPSHITNKCEWNNCYIENIPKKQKT